MKDHSQVFFVLDTFFIYISNVIPFPSFLSKKSPILSPLPLLLKPPSPASWPWHSPILGHIIFTRPRASPPIDGRLGHFLIHMQLEAQLWEVRVSSYCCSTYRLADPSSSLGTFSSSSTGGPVFHPIDDCEHPLLHYLLIIHYLKYEG